MREFSSLVNIWLLENFVTAIFNKSNLFILTSVKGKYSGEYEQWKWQRPWREPRDISEKSEGEWENEEMKADEQEKNGTFYCPINLN